VLSLIGSVIYLSSLVSAVAATPLATSTGRKGVMWAMAVLVVAATALGASAGSLGQIFAARAVAGLAVGLGFQAPVMYTAEVAPAKVRGAALSIWGGVLLMGFATPVIWNWGLANKPTECAYV
jgi:MFS family permease